MYTYSSKLLLAYYRVRTTNMGPFQHWKKLPTTVVSFHLDQVTGRWNENIYLSS